MSLVDIQDFSSLIDNKPYFDQPVKSKQEADETLIDMSKNDEYTAGNLLDYLYYQSCYIVIGIDLSRQTSTIITQQINFVRKLGKDDDATMLFISEKQQKAILDFSIDLLIATG